MKKTLIITSALLLISYLFLSCGKYDEGPEFTVLPKKMRITGTWELTEISDTGLAIPLNSIKTLNLKNNFDGSFSRTGSEEGTENIEFKWSFTDNKQNIRFDYDNETSEYYIVEDSVNLTIDYIKSEKFEIIRLKNSELWLKGYFDIIYKFGKI